MTLATIDESGPAAACEITSAQAPYLWLFGVERGVLRVKNLGAAHYILVCEEPLMSSGKEREGACSARLMIQSFRDLAGALLDLFGEFLDPICHPADGTGHGKNCDH